MKDETCPTTLSPEELAAWWSYKDVMDNFLGNERVDNYEEMAQQLLKSFRELDSRMSRKIHFIHQHLNFFPDNVGAISVKHEERFHQEMKMLYQGQHIPNIMGDVC